MFSTLRGFFALILFVLVVPAFAGVTVTSPKAGSTPNQQVNYVATATAPTCASGVAAMGVYVNNALVYQVNGASLNTTLTLSPGSYYTVVQEWDHCGGATSTPVSVNVTNGSTQNGVTVTSPANGSTVTSPVTYTATAGTTTCASGIAAMGIYVNSTLAYQVNGSSLNTKLTLSDGTYNTVVQAWDNCGGALSKAVNITVNNPKPPTITLSASSSTITAGSSTTLKAMAQNATQVVITGTNGTSYTLSSTGGTQAVTPTATTTYTAKATGPNGNTTAATTINVVPVSDLQQVGHVVFMLQENRTFDTYFGMLNPYRVAKGWTKGADGITYSVDGIDDKLTTIRNQSDDGTPRSLFKLKSTCVDDMSSSWLESYGDISRYDFTLNRPIAIDGFVHTAEGFAKSCQAAGGVGCAGTFDDFAGRRAMGYYDEGFLNYYYYMASQFALSDRWFSPLSSKSKPNRIATFSGGTTQGLAFDPGADDHLPQLQIPTIFEKLSTANVSWKIYYTVTQGACLDPDDCSGDPNAAYPATTFSYFAGANKYMYQNPSKAACVAPTKPSSVVGDSSNSFCIDSTHIVPLSMYYNDLANNTLPSFAFIEAGYGVNDEHPGSGQSILSGQQQVANVVNALMTSTSWKNSVFFMSYDEGGGPYDHVPPVQGHSNDNTSAMVGNTPVGNIPDVASISVNPDSYFPCLPSGGIPTTNCDLHAGEPGTNIHDAPAMQGFAAQVGFRLPNLVISPFTRKHYVSHIPMDHTAILKFVESRFIGSSEHLTARDAAQPDLLDFFDFSAKPWLTPPTPPTPVSNTSLGYDACRPSQM